MKNYIPKNIRVFTVFILLLVSAFSGNAKAASAFLKNQSYHFSALTASGVDGTLALFKHYSTTQFFSIVAYQTMDGATKNSVHILALIDNSSLPWGDVVSLSTMVTAGGMISTNETSFSLMPGNFEILQNEDITVLNGAQTIDVVYVLTLSDGSLLELSSKLKLNVL
jgi:hypothetical protein